MKLATLILAALPYFLHAQPKIEKLVIGAGGHSVKQSFTNTGEVWQVTAMDPGTSLEITKGSLFFAITATEGGLLLVGGSCHGGGTDYMASSFYVAITPPVNIIPGTVVVANCGQGRYIRIDRMPSQ